MIELQEARILHSDKEVDEVNDWLKSVGSGIRYKKYDTVNIYKGSQVHNLDENLNLVSTYTPESCQ
jgi:hypothetical protein